MIAGGSGMHVLGVDLAGPACPANTGIAAFGATGDELRFVRQECNGSDAALYTFIEQLADNAPVVIGIDAPLSYQPGGGQRLRDAELRKLIVKRGMRSGSIMAPTAPRMVYLTLRGIALASVLRRIESRHPIRIVEVHPGATLCLGGAPIDAVLAFSSQQGVRSTLLGWLERQGLRGIDVPADCTSHFVAACAAALAAWNWHRGISRWCVQADLPWHGYEFAA
jgi:predicted nuclease with RNAse H fold